MSGMHYNGGTYVPVYQQLPSGYVYVPQTQYVKTYKKVNHSTPTTIKQTPTTKPPKSTTPTTQKKTTATTKKTKTTTKTKTTVKN